MFDFLLDPQQHARIVAWVGAICTLGILTIIYRENAIYRLFEHIFIGVAAGYAVYTTWTEVLLPMWWAPMTCEGKWYWIFALVVGSLFYFIYAGKHSWLSRLLFGGLMGLAAGAAIKGFVMTYIPRITASYKPVAGHALSDRSQDLGVSALSLAANNIVMGIVLVTVMSYFLFSFEHKAKAMRVSALTGRWCLMFAFGAMFGATVMARMSLFIARAYFLLNDWLQIVR